MKIFFTVICTMLISVSYGQKDNKEQRTIFYAGFGSGLDYGGFGLKAEYLPVKHFAIFAGAGMNFDKIGYNGGLSFKLLPDKKSTPFLTGMYGYNAVLKVKGSGGNTFFAQTYYGFSVGAGYDISVGKSRNKISLSILVPFRNSAFNNKYDQLKASGYTFNPDISKVLGSIGFNIGSSDK